MSELDFYESALRDILGDDEDAIWAELEDLVYPRMHLVTNQIASTGFAQVGRDDYWEEQQYERDFLLKRIPELCGEPPDNAKLQWKGFEHDFGTYHEVCLLMDENNKKHWDYYNKVEQLDYGTLEEEIRMLWIQEHDGGPDDFKHLITK